MSPPRSAQTSFDFSARAGVNTELTRHTHPLRSRLKALETEHEKLLASIKRKRAAVEVSAELHERSSRELTATLLSLRERGTEAIRKLRNLLETLAGPDSKLSKRDRKRVATVLHEVIEALPADELDLGEASAPPADGSPWGFEGQCDAANESGGLPAESGFSAAKPGARQASLKALFKRLAMAAHPDRVQDEQEKLDRTQVMSEVSQAYERGDLARLLELERCWLTREELRRDDDEALRREIERLTATNKELRRQLRELQQAARELRDGPGVVEVDGKVRFHAPVQCMLDDMEAMVASLELFHRFTERFAGGEMSVEAFLEGPELPDELPDEDIGAEAMAIPEGLLEAILGDFVVERPPRRKTVRRRKKQKKRRK